MQDASQYPSLERDWEIFLAIERANRDAIHFSKIYVDMTGDLHAGLLLSQIVYWYLPDFTGRTKLRVERESPTDGKRYLWLAKKREDWWDEIRLTPKQVDRALQILVKLGLVETARFKFDSVPVVHVRIVKERFLELYRAQLRAKSQHDPILPKGENPFSPNGENNNKATTNTISSSEDPADSSSTDDQLVCSSEIDILPEGSKLDLSQRDPAIRATRKPDSKTSESWLAESPRSDFESDNVAAPDVRKTCCKQAEPRPP